MERNPYPAETPEWRMFFDLAVSRNQVANLANEVANLREKMNGRETLVSMCSSAREVGFEMEAERTVKFAVQRHGAKIEDWHTIAITPHEARARRIMTRKRDLATRCEFRLITIETTITPVDDKQQE